jgi:hypothetical protein
LLRKIGVVVIGLAVGACAAQGGPTASTSVTALDPSTAPPVLESPSAPPSASVFDSSRRGYRVEIPPGWNVNEYGGAWEALSEFTPGGEIPGEDVIAPPDFGSFLVMNSMPIPPDMTPDAWHSAFQALVSAGLPADCPGTTRSATFAGEPATIVEQTCAGSSIVGRSLVHGGRGYYFTTLSPYPDPPSEAIVDALAASIEVTD